MTFYADAVLTAMVVTVHLIACAFLAIFGVHRVWLLAEYLRDRKSKPALEKRDGPLPFVTVQLPMYNEGAVAERLLRAAARFDYPLDAFEIQVLDDSNDECSDICARVVADLKKQGINIEHIQRENRVGYKAGALAYGLEFARGELVAIFDADFDPPRSFLRDMVVGFDNPEVGMVQARWTHINRDESWLTRAQALFLDAHFTIEHRVRDVRGRFFNFNGTAGVWKKSAIDAAGGWDSATLTEDLDLSVRAQLSGSRFRYFDHVEVPAELPDNINAFKGQQHRWAKGSLQTARRLLVSLWRSDLTFVNKVDASLKLLQNTAFLVLAVVVATMPAVALLRATSATSFERLADLTSLSLATIPVAVHFFWAQRACGTSFLKSCLELPLALGLGGALSFHNGRAVIEGWFNLGSNVFVRTQKKGAIAKYFDTSAFPILSLVELTAGLFHLAAAIVLSDQGYFLTTPFLWLFGFSLCFLGTASLVSPLKRLVFGRANP